MKTLFALFIAGLIATPPAWGDGKKKKNYSKTQEVNFDGSDIEGIVRSPDGAYLLQKQGVKFMPLYKIEKQFDRNIKESIEYLR